MNNWLRELLLTCPYFNDLKAIGVDMLSKDNNTASIEKTPVKSLIKDKLNGNKLKQTAFVIRANFPHSNELENNIKNSDFYDNFEDWIDELNDKGDFPFYTKDKEVYEIDITTCGYLVNINPNLRQACYQIQLIVKYEKKDLENPFKDFF